MPLFFGARSQLAAARTVQVLLPAVVCSPFVFGWFDAALSVFQVPLTDDGACQGGLLVFACDDGRLVHAERRTGNILAHDGDAVHGVTALVKGVRLVARFSTFRSRRFPFSLHQTLLVISLSLLLHQLACMGYLRFAREVAQTRRLRGGLPNKFVICMRPCTRAHYAHIRARVMNSTLLRTGDGCSTHRAMRWCRNAHPAAAAFTCSAPPPSGRTPRTARPTAC